MEKSIELYNILAKWCCAAQLRVKSSSDERRAQPFLRIVQQLENMIPSR